MKLKIGGSDNRVGSSCNVDYFLKLFVYNFTILAFEDKKHAPKLGDILILIALRFNNILLNCIYPKWRRYS